MIYYNHQGKPRAEELLVDSLARADSPKSYDATQRQQQPFVEISTSLPPFATFSSANGFGHALPSTTQSFQHPIQLLFRYNNNNSNVWTMGIGSCLPWVVPPRLPRARARLAAQRLVTAAQAAMDEAIARFASYAERGVLAFGGDRGLFGGLDSVRPTTLSGVATLNIFPYQAFGGFDSATTASASAAAGAGTEIMSMPYRRVDPNILGGGLVGGQQRGPWTYPATCLRWE